MHAVRTAPIVQVAALCGALLFGCASPQQPSTSQADYKSRAVTRSDGGLRVSAATLSAKESASVYGAPLASQRIQPVWIEVENREDRPYFLLSPGLDPNFYPASEAAEAMAQGNLYRLAELDRRFRDLAFRNPVPPGATVSGFVLTNLGEAVKVVQLDLVANGRARTFSMFTTVPGFRGDYHASGVFKQALYAPGDVVNYTDDAAFRAALEALPCCATNKDGTRKGDPLNLVVVGGLDDAFPALVRRGWRPSEQTWRGSVLRMARSFLSGEGYAYAPVSNLFLFGRAQDLALQKARDSIHQRNHLRLWLSPMLYHGKQVWVGQISRDIGSRLTVHSPTLTTHKIDPDVDEARGALMEDMAYSQSLAKLGLVDGVGAAARSAPRKNLTTDPYHTDGRRSVLVFERRPIALDAIEILPWIALAR
ncbi:MAG TPA: LssY C-terminal domain-containing protein [Burkholderiales bacterium]|nr:LssY C-terminal domain-containing protein [Burkholderiales bacterium]